MTLGLTRADHVRRVRLPCIVVVRMLLAALRRTPVHLAASHPAGGHDGYRT